MSMTQKRKPLLDPNRHFNGKPLGVWVEKPKPGTQDPKPAPKPGKKPPLTEPLARIDWPKLDLDKVETFITNANGVPAWEAVEQANKEGKIIIPNCVHDRMLMETDHWQKPEIKAGYWAWTGTGVVYEAPGKQFGGRVVFNWQDENVKYSVSFSVPKQFQGKKDSVLVVEHPDFVFVPKGNNRFELKVKDENLVQLVENFPVKNGWYSYDERFRIPVGNPAESSDSNARHLWRIDGNSYVGLLARCFYYIKGDYRQNVYANRRLSDRLGVHIIDPNGSAPKK